jgi:hypothetical protein
VRQVKHDVMAVQARAEQAVTEMVQQMAPQARVTLTKLPQPKMKVAAVAPALPDVETAPSAPIVAQTLEQPVAAVPAPALVLNEPATALAPRGDGDPDTITCRAPQALPGSRLPGPQVCKANRVWAQLRADGKDVAPDGSIATARNLPTTAGNCSKSALLGAFQSQNLPDGSVLSGCR